MSKVLLIAADRPLPLEDHQDFREHRSGRTVMSYVAGFQVAPLDYWRNAVEALDFEILPFRYELQLEHCQEDLDQLISYLCTNLFTGDSVELWSLWLGSDGAPRPRRYQGTIADFDLETLGMLTETLTEPDPDPESDRGELICQVCVSILM